jgi:hypothetical protein
MFSIRDRSLGSSPWPYSALASANVPEQRRICRGGAATVERADFTVESEPDRYRRSSPP